MDTVGVKIGSAASDRRAVILAAATKLFAQNGYSGTRMSDIADAISVTKPIVYRYFTSKEDLFTAWVDATLVLNRDEIIARLDGAENSIKQETFEFLLRAAERMTTQEFLTPWRIAFIESDNSPKIAQEIYEKFKLPIFQSLTRVFEYGVNNGEIKPADPKILAGLFVSPIIAAASMMSTFARDVLSPEELKQFLTSHHEAFFAAWHL